MLHFFAYFCYISILLNTKEDGIKQKGQFAVSEKLKWIMTTHKLSIGALSKLAGVASATVSTARDGKRVSIEKVAMIAAALQNDVKDVFRVWDSTTGLSDRTILHHHRVITAILEKAKRSRIIPYNVASEHATSPKVKRTEAVYLDGEQAWQIVGLLFAEDDIRVKTAILLLLYSGVRRGELCDLEWRDIDFERQLIHINRASQYQKGIGMVAIVLPLGLGILGVFVCIGAGKKIVKMFSK